MQQRPHSNFEQGNADAPVCALVIAACWTNRTDFGVQSAGRSRGRRIIKDLIKSLARSESAGKKIYRPRVLPFRLRVRSVLGDFGVVRFNGFAAQVSGGVQPRRKSQLRSTLGAMRARGTISRIGRLTCMFSVADRDLLSRRGSIWSLQAAARGA